MKSSKKHIDQKIKRKVENYEFDFSDHAWDKMETLMDSPPPPTRSNHLFTFRNFTIMILLLIILYFGVNFPSSENIKLAEKQPVPIMELPATTETTNPKDDLASIATTSIEEKANDEKTVIKNKNNAPQRFKKSTDIKRKRNNPQGQNKTEPLTKAVPTPRPEPISKIDPPVVIDPVVKDSTLTVISEFEQSTPHPLIQRLTEQLNEYQNHYRPEKVYLQFDRLFFKPGEAIWFNAYLRDANTLKASKQSEIVYVELNSPNGNTLKTLKLVAKKGQGFGDFQLAPDAVGGLYTVKAYTNWQRNRKEFFERKIQIQNAVLPRLIMELDFEREAYGPGDKVTATFDVKRLDNKPLSKRSLGFAAMIAGQVIESAESKTDKEGQASIQFTLPKDLNSTDGLLNIVIEHEGQNESIARSIPIVLNKIDLQFLPEGGEMLNGFPARVAFKALNEFGQPADVEGELYNSKGEKVSHFRTYHQGMGLLNFQPQTGERYYARITQPENITEDYPFPLAMTRGYALQLGTVTENTVKVEVHTTETEPLFLVLHARGQIYETKTFDATAGSQTIELSTTEMPIGMAQVTLFDSKEIPRAERLVFLHPEKQLDIKITTDKERYRPREKVTMKIAIKDERGIPMPGQFSLSVANDNLLTFADDKQGNILSYLLLESELKGEVTEPNFYFDPADKHPEKDQLLALDYLMLTQGWRRFGWEEMEADPAIAMKFDAERAIISGIVLNEIRQPVADAIVQIEGTGHQVMSDQNGKFKFEDVVLYNNKMSVSILKDQLKRSYTVSNYEEGRELQFSKNTYNTTLQKNIAGTGKHTIEGVVNDENGEPLPFANILITGTSTGATTDFDGRFSIENVPAKDCQLEVAYIGYASKQINYQVNGNNDQLANIVLEESGMQLSEVVVVDYKVALIEKDNTTSGAVITSEEIRALPTKNISALAATVSGVSASDEGDAVTVRGSRSDATAYYIDGIRVSSTELKDARIADQKMKEERQASALDFWDNDRNSLNAHNAKVGFEDRFEQHKYALNFRKGYYRSRAFYIPNYQQKATTVTERTDFRPTIYWNPSVKVGRDGTAELEFFTCDEMTTFRATIEGLSSDGNIGRTEHLFYSQLPFGLNLKLPERVLSGDVLTIPLTLSNHSDKAVEGQLQMEIPQEFELQKQPAINQQLAVGESKTLYLSFLAKASAAVEGEFNVSFLSEGLNDGLRQSVKIIPRGFPVEKLYSGDQKEQLFELPLSEPIEGTVSASFTAYPSLADDLVAGMERMLRQPSGCFEQTSSCNYPNVLVLDYLKSTNNLNKAIKKKTRKFLKKGYYRLLGFEVSGGGFDWYGKAPANEVLTAYGLLQFVDMDEVFPVDQEMVERNARWLLSRRDGTGGWKRNARGSRRWKGGDPISDAYIVWALAEAGMGDSIEKELEKSYRDAMEQKDPYLLALMANALYAVGDRRASEIMDILLPLQTEQGSWVGTRYSVMHSRGIGLAIETTSLTVLAIMKKKTGVDRVASAMSFIKGAKSSYGFGSTQSTVLAMKALVATAKYQNNQWKNGNLALYINGKKVAKHKYKYSDRNPIVIDGLETYLTAGENEVKVKFGKEESILPYEIRLQYHTRQPNNSKNCLVAMTTELAATNATMGENIRLTITLRNTSTAAVPNMITKIGIPAGLSVQPWQLKELQEKEVFDFYEMFDGYIVFHYRGLDASVEKVIHLDLKADIPGTYEAPASVAYLYYTNEDQVWSKPSRVVVRP